MQTEDLSTDNENNRDNSIINDEPQPKSSRKRIRRRLNDTEFLNSSSSSSSCKLIKIYYF